MTKNNTYLADASHAARNEALVAKKPVLFNGSDTPRSQLALSAIKGGLQDQGGRSGRGGVGLNRCRTSQHETLNECWFNVKPTSQKEDQH